MSRNATKLCQGMFRWGVRKKLFSERADQALEEAAQELVESPPWRYLRGVDVDLRTQCSGGLGSAGLAVGLNDLRGFFQTKYFYDSMILQNEVIKKFKG